ncbi:MAG: HEAT repeat domain-containing protein [Halobacteriovoraceae bacterium]|nr:HEAT repeat domain-containing protein [Halobacteriovoraceae bacterium]
MITKSILIFSIVTSVYCSTKEPQKLLLEQNFLNLKNDEKEIKSLKQSVLNKGGKAVPTLIKVMKKDEFPDHSRWVATFLLGQIMKDKAVPFIARFSEHPNWIMRMASLKTLLAMKQTKYSDIYAFLLKDKSLIVRTQALENIRKLNLTKYAPQVWAMLYDKRNYYENKKDEKDLKNRKHIIKEVITAIGDLGLKKAIKPLLSMSQKKKYHDIFEEIDYSLSILLEKKSPKNLSAKKHFWKKMALSNVTI